MAFDRDGFRGLSKIYNDRDGNPRGLRGFGEASFQGLKSNLGSDLWPDSAAAFGPTSGAGPQATAFMDPDYVFPPLDYTRRLLRRLADMMRRDTSKRAAELRNMIQPVTDGCVGGKSIMDGSVQNACDKNISPERILTPLGVINIFEIPLPITDLLNTGEDGELKQVFVPDYYQRWWAAYSAYAASQMRVGYLVNAIGPTDRVPSICSGIGCGDQHLDPVGEKSRSQHSPLENIIADFDPLGMPYESDDDRKRFGILGLIAKTSGSVGQWAYTQETIPANYNFGNTYAYSTKYFITYWPGYPLNPIQPTDAELTGSNGLYNYYKRGGYLLDPDVMRGRTAIWQGTLKYTSGYFMCPDGKLAAATEKIPDEGHGWIAKVAFAPEQWTISVRMEDRSTWESVKKAVHDAVKKVLDTVCGMQPLAIAVAQAAMTAPKCRRQGTASPQQKQQMGCSAQEIMAPAGTPLALSCDAKVYVCKQGEPNCLCTGPSQQRMMQQQAMLAAGAAVLAATCKAMAPNTPIPCPPPMETPTTIPWWVIGAGVAVVGAALYSKNHKKA